MDKFKSEPFLDSDFSQFESIEHLRLKLKELKSLQLNNLDQEQIKKVIFDYFGLVPSQVAYFNPENFNKYYFYRARVNVNPNEDLNLIKTYSYPLPQFCKTNGRANLKNKSAFYCSNFALTAIFETKPQINDIGYLSVWKGNTQRKIKAGILLPEDLKKENPWTELAKDIHQNLREHNKENPSEKNLYQLEIIKFISDLYMNESPNYPLTSWIANEMLYGENWKDFIVYPSTVNQFMNCNYAFHPNSADRFLSFEKVIRFKVIDKVGENYTMSTGRVGEIINTNMIWRNATEEELNMSLLP